MVNHADIVGRWTVDLQVTYSVNQASGLGEHLAVQISLWCFKSEAVHRLRRCRSRCVGI